MHKAVIIDDEKQVIKDLKGMLQMYCPKLEVAGTASTSKEAAELIQKLQPEIVFLDVQIDEKTGLQLLQEIGTNNFQVIFVTAHQHYAIDAFKFSAVDYLLKPVDPEELINAVDKALEAAGQKALRTQLNALVHNLGQEFKTKKIVLTDLEGVHVIDVPDILWCHANGSYTEFHLATGKKMVISKHLKTYENLLEKYGFYRIHRSYLINGNAIVKVDRSQGMVVMKNDHNLPVSIPVDMLKLILDRLQS
ncbi:MAG: LytTR family DNA-binding domain-containing protein [Cyclobacteriaceae bacterium]